jgi:hypothetical protein
MRLLPNRQPQVVLGSRGPFWGKRDLGLSNFSIPLADLNTHMYVVGRSGKGKSKFLEGFLWQLITHGEGCGLIDPHGDLANNLLKLLAFQPSGSNRQPWLSDPANAQRLIYCEPGREDFFMPMNVLASPETPYTMATNVIEAFQRTWSRELSAAPQFKNVALHGLLLLIEHGMSLIELPQLFMYQDFREPLLEASRNEDVVGFFRQRFDRWGHDQALRLESLLNKVTAFTLNVALKRMLGDSENRLEPRQIMDEGKILIVNLGTCDHETRDLLGSLLTVRLEQAAMSRIEMEEGHRRRWFCILDEFQRFVANEGSAQVLAHMLSEARKMKLFLCLAHQGWHQLGNSRLEGAIDQAQLKVVFGSGTKTARVIAEELFEADPARVKHPAGHEKAHPLFESLMEQKELFVQRIRQLRNRQTLLLPPESDQPLSLRTLTVPNPEVTPQQLEEVKLWLLNSVGKRVLQTSPPTGYRKAEQEQETVLPTWSMQ